MWRAISWARRWNSSVLATKSVSQSSSTSTPSLGGRVGSGGCREGAPTPWGGAVCVQVGADPARGGAAAGPLLDAALAGLAQQLRGPFHVAAGLAQRVPAVHHSGSGGVPERLALSGRDLHVGWCSLL